VHAARVGLDFLRAPAGDEHLSRRQGRHRIDAFDHQLVLSGTGRLIVRAADGPSGIFVISRGVVAEQNTRARYRAIGRRHRAEATRPRT
jgi:hypothetical protein